MKIRSELLSFVSPQAPSQAISGDSVIAPDCENYVKRQGSGLRVLWKNDLAFLSVLFWYWNCNKLA